MQIVKCQHCQRKVALKVPREVSFSACPRCGKTTPTRPDEVEPDTTPRTLVEDPSRMLM